MRSERFIHVLGALVVVSGAIYLSWLFAFALEWSHWWLAAPVGLAHAEAYGAALLFLFNAWHHPQPGKGPPPIGDVTVDIFIPTVDETFAVLGPAVIAAVAVRYPHETWVLDDGARGWVGELCDRAGAHWLRGEGGAQGKAGNLNHGLANSSGEFIATLDADFVARDSFIDDLVGYFADAEVALMQAPQVYYNTNSFQHARETSLWNEQSMFYEVVQPGRDRWNATFWCGSPAMLRRSALEAVGGVWTGSVTEDLATTLALHKAGWRSRYHNGLVAAGIAPEDFARFFRQRVRWVRGGTQALGQQILRPGLTLAQRVSYIGSSGRPWDALRQLVFHLVVPAILVTGQLPVDPEASTVGLFFAAQGLLLVATVCLGRGTYRIVQAQVYDILTLGAGLQALAALWQRHPPRFSPTVKGRGEESSRWARPLLWVVGLAALYIVAIPFGIARVASGEAEGAMVVATAWAVAMAALMVACLAFAAGKGMRAWRGLPLSEAVRIRRGGEVVEAETMRVAVDQVVVRLQAELAAGDSVSLETGWFKTSIAGVVESQAAVRGGGFEVVLAVPEPPYELAAFVSGEMFRAEADSGVTVAGVKAMASS
ncbi:MAG: glycosyltransferase family 2 protein [Dehalococcoidia bacterium]